MPTPTPNAARVGDPIKHTNALFGALVGIAAGIVIGALVAVTTIVTAGTGLLFWAAVFGAAAALCTGAAGGYTLGSFLGKLSGSKSGVIAEGAKTVFIGEGSPAAARALDHLACGDPPMTKYGWSMLGAVLLGPVGGMAGLIYGHVTSKHAGAQIATGSETVYIENFNAARVGDKTSCTGEIMEGAETVGIGGESVALIDPATWSPEIPAALDTTMYWVDKAGIVFGILSLAGSLAGSWRVLRWKAVNTDFIITGIDLGLLGTEEILAAKYGRDHEYTDTVENIRATYELATTIRTGVKNLHTISKFRPLPPGGQSVFSRWRQGGKPPPWAANKPYNYYFDMSSRRYKLRR